MLIEFCDYYKQASKSKYMWGRPVSVPGFAIASRNCSGFREEERGLPSIHPCMHDSCFWFSIDPDGGCLSTYSGPRTKVIVITTKIEWGESNSLQTFGTKYQLYAYLVGLAGRLLCRQQVGDAGRLLMAEDNIMSMIPDVPATKQQHRVEVFRRYRWRPGHFPEFLN